MIRVKDRSVKVTELHPSVWHAIYQFDALRKAHGMNNDTVITSGNDGNHSHQSLHYSNRAADLRTNDMPPEKSEAIEHELKQVLGIDYDVFLEQLGTPNEHLHIESQAKRR